MPRKPSYPSREALAARSSGREVTSIGEHAATTLDRPRMACEMLRSEQDRSEPDVAEPGGIPPTAPTPEVLPVAGRGALGPWVTRAAVVVAALALGALAGACVAWRWG